MVFCRGVLYTMTSDRTSVQPSLQMVLGVPRAEALWQVSVAKVLHHGEVYIK